ncbi:protein of unknown function [Alcaligenes faecalis subsp. faecalis]|nr:protein of unknown function [Alcaligenes faecalis subsp. faecalis]
MLGERCVRDSVIRLRIYVVTPCGSALLAFSFNYPSSFNTRIVTGLVPVTAPVIIRKNLCAARSVRVVVLTESRERNGKNLIR